jgi:transcriptional regulator with GAF, ATPase, and Fis domain
VSSAARRTELEGATPPAAVRRPVECEPLLGLDGGLHALASVLDRIAVSTSTVLIRGETGVGKELVARELHRRSPREGGPFVRTNCAALADGLLESELFGHEAGSFTGSLGTRAGRFEAANGGTLFLDEIAEISPKVQVALLRVLQDSEFQRVGSNRTLHVDVRIIAATNAALEEKVARHEFREDLFYRLNVVPLYVPPLRERAQDIRPLACSFIERFAARLGKRLTLSEAALERLQSHPWPGNVRELRNVVERACVLSDHEARIEPEQLYLESEAVAAAPSRAPLATRQIYAEIAREDAMRLAAALREARGSKARAARLLGIPRTTLNDRLRRLDVE